VMRVPGAHAARLYGPNTEHDPLPGIQREREKQKAAEPHAAWAPSLAVSIS
jgi:hypothetical protein